VGETRISVDALRMGRPAASVWASKAVNTLWVSSGVEAAGLKLFHFGTMKQNGGRWVRRAIRHRDRFSKYQLAVGIRRVPKFPRLCSQPAQPTARDQAPKSFR